MEREYINVMEEIVVALVQFLMTGTEYQTFCKCSKCKTDIIALSLNNLPNHYVTTEEGRKRVMEQLNSLDNRKWINKRIIKAIHVVGKYPQHAEEKKLNVT
ncbi:late competence development ComFB family protein [Bacillus sp. MUM 13]|uniref:late competence development ComFB family protein n=1 Tax=Bacillus sp. MUM 13 TaxID=1678001 RepID=UPI0008F5847A|nr:late competence development ComFB family protein [Bacillus sp. MUM 13]OIK11661.1 competence protein ComFB [Bacillus sp. MUM 13]